MEIELKQADKIMTLRFNRPEKKNAITAAMYRTMADALRVARDDSQVRVVLIRGGANTFSAGNDLEDFMKAPPLDHDAPVLQFLRQISTMNKPIVAAVGGVAVGVGVTLLLHCDLVYAAPGAMFSLPFAQLGLCPEAASSLLLPRLAGHVLAAEKLMLGEPFDVNEAYRMGIINRIVPAEQVDEYACEQALKLAKLPASSLRVTKALLKRASEHEIATRMDEETAHFAQMLRSPEAKEAMTAFFEKRRPEFSQFD